MVMPALMWRSLTCHGPGCKPVSGGFKKLWPMPVACYIVCMAWWRQRFGKWQARLLAQLTRRTPSETAFLLLLPVVGLVVGLASVSIAHLIDSLQHKFWGGGESFLDAMAGNPRPLLLIIP